MVPLQVERMHAVQVTEMIGPYQAGEANGQRCPDAAAQPATSGSVAAERNGARTPG